MSELLFKRAAAKRNKRPSESRARLALFFQQSFQRVALGPNMALESPARIGNSLDIIGDKQNWDELTRILPSSFAMLHFFLQKEMQHCEMNFPRSKLRAIACPSEENEEGRMLHAELIPIMSNLVLPCAPRVPRG